MLLIRKFEIIKIHKLKILFYILLLISPFIGKSQNIDLLNQFNDSIKANALLMVGAQDFEQKIIYSDKVSYFVQKLMKQEKSINYKMDSTNLVKVLTSKNKKFRIFTWVVPTDDNKFIFKGVVQTYSKSRKDYRIIELKDKTHSIHRPYSKMLSAAKWYGAYYYKVIQTKRGSKYFYTLLGWKGNDKMVQSKIVEIATIKNNGDISFGYSLFKIKDYEYFKSTPSVKRLIFSYSSKATMYLNYDYQTIVLKTYKKTKHKKTKQKYGFNAQAAVEKPNEKIKTIKDNLIVMDRLVPVSPELKEFSDFYYPESNIMDALRFEKSQWRYYPDIDARTKSSSSNKKQKKIEYNLTPSK